MSLEQALLLLAAGALSGFLNVMSAGGSMLTLPVLMFMGLDSTTANGTNRVGIVLQNITATWKYRSAGHRHLRLGLKLSVPAVLGAIVGAWVATLVGEDLFRWILILVMVGSSVLMLLPMPVHRETLYLDESHLRWPVILAMAVIGFYGGFIQVAVGILFIVLLYRILRIDLVQVNILKVLVVLIYMLPALGIFVATGNVHWGFGLVLAVGSMAGAWLAAHMTLGPRGAVWIKRITLAIIAAIIVKLLMDM
ncbi:sulfite exporter TauE/SafE family protein [Thioalkalivibrio sulfidiphilus]|uniref:sulfite exporter TauE/SafE family protein n=1 Tax=Thioalkalivibrio sulfidiphilus TaxID=1033854 RepID=UPI003B2C3CAB